MDDLAVRRPQEEKIMKTGAAAALLLFAGVGAVAAQDVVITPEQDAQTDPQSGSGSVSCR
ncbi:hypothetical protein ACFSOZ_14375 [Mesorhizobium newzealandense]|uniref:Uncharacterized protein n=1 Tax=Mesorhizobium newzealandense TaxID=1300302 RepID=A0ABW4UAE4_9HYPH